MNGWCLAIKHWMFSTLTCMFSFQTCLQSGGKKCVQLTRFLFGAPTASARERHTIRIASKCRQPNAAQYKFYTARFSLLLNVDITIGYNDFISKCTDIISKSHYFKVFSPKDYHSEEFYSERSLFKKVIFQKFGKLKHGAWLKHGLSE